MSDVRLIDANALKRQAVEVEIVTPPHNHYCSELVVFGYDIDEAPTIDAVPVVRCRECYYRDKPTCCPYQYSGFKVEPDWYCPMGVNMAEKEG